MAPHFFHLFGALQQLANLKVTQTRRDNLAEKRHEKRNPSPLPIALSDVVWVGQPAPPLSTEEKARIASISNPTVSSSGGQQYTAAQEKETDLFGNAFCATTLRLLYLGRNQVPWAEARTELPVLEWRHRYIPDNTI